MPHSEAVKELIAAVEEARIILRSVTRWDYLYTSSIRLHAAVERVKAEEKPQTHPGIPEHVATVHQIGGK